MNAFDDWFARNMPDVEEWAAQFAAEPVVARPVVEPAGEGFLVPPGLGEQIALNARKLGAYMNVPDELLMDAGLIPDTRPPLPAPSWRTRFRWKRQEWRERAARRAFRIIAGYWPSDGEDD